MPTARASATATQTAGEIELFVAGDVGNDQWSGLQSDRPLATLVEAIRRIPGTVRDRIIIHVASAPAPYEVPDLGDREYEAMVWIIGDGAEQDGQDGFDVLSGPSNAQAGTTIDQVVLPAGLGINTFRGKTIEVLTGDAAGDRRTIRDHDDTTVVPVRQFSAAVAQGDSVRIVEPAVTIRPPDEGWRVSGGRYGKAHFDDVPTLGVGFVNLMIETTVNNQAMVMTGQLVCYGIDRAPGSSGGQFVGDRSTELLIGNDRGVAFGSNPTSAGEAQGAFGLPSPQSWYGWGWRSDILIDVWRGLKAEACGLVLERMPIFAGHWTVLGMNVFANGINVLEGPFTALMRGDDVGTDIDALITGGIAWGIQLIDHASRGEVRFAQITHSAGGDAVIARNGALIELDETVTIDTTGTALLAEFGGRIHMTDTPAVQGPPTDDARVTSGPNRISDETRIEAGADGAAGNPISERALTRVPAGQGDLVIRAIEFIPEAAVAADGANFATLVIHRRNDDGTNQTQIASGDTSAGWAQWDPQTIAVTGGLETLSAGQLLTFEVTKSGTGQDFPPGVLVVYLTPSDQRDAVALAHFVGAGDFIASGDGSVIERT